MTVFKRGSVLLNCLMCGHGDFDIVVQIRLAGRVVRCKRCGFMIKESGYFDQMPEGTSVPVDGPSLFAVRKGGWADGGL